MYSLLRSHVYWEHSAPRCPHSGSAKNNCPCASRSVVVFAEHQEKNLTGSSEEVSVRLCGASFLTYFTDRTTPYLVLAQSVPTCPSKSPFPMAAFELMSVARTRSFPHQKFPPPNPHLYSSDNVHGLRGLPFAESKDQPCAILFSHRDHLPF